MSETARPSASSSIQIVVADQLPASAVERLKRPGWSVVITAGQDVAVRDAALATADALVVRATKVTTAILEKAPRLRAVAPMAGVDTIDVDAATARIVINAPGANSVSVAG
jgi:phosphoglycerate dehydrogenase-like enzyme